MEILVLLITALLPILAIGLFVYLVLRLAIRHEHRNHPDR
jgi:type IV secretory pathway VirB3-like protein